MEGAGHAIQGIKPVFMMSRFRLRVIFRRDVSNLTWLFSMRLARSNLSTPLGRLYVGTDGRSRRQQAATADEFFDFTSSEEPVDDDEAPTSDIESILGMFSARGAHQRIMRSSTTAAGMSR